MKNEERKKIYSIDFDGTIAAPGKFPEIGKAIDKVVRYIYEIQNRHDKWILLTNREGDDLDKAMIWLAERGLYPDAVNDNLPEMQKFFRRNPRKVFANVMIDDLNAGGVYLPPAGRRHGLRLRHPCIEGRQENRKAKLEGRRVCHPCRRHQFPYGR